MKKAFCILLLIILIAVLVGIIAARASAAGTTQPAEPEAVPPCVNEEGIKTIEIKTSPEECADEELEPADCSCAAPDAEKAYENPAGDSGKPEFEYIHTSVSSEAKTAPRYAGIIPYISAEDIDIIAAAVYQEANNQSFEGQQAVAEVIFNRMLNEAFPNTAYEVLYQRYNGSWQFSTAPLLASTTPNQTNYDAVFAALYGPQVLDSTDVVFFSTFPLNNRIADHIGAHYFCREYIW